jgi:predicted nuclease with TOPRIM domain
MSTERTERSLRIKSNVDLDMEKYVDTLLENKEYVRDAIKNRNAELYKKKLIIDHLKVTYTELENRYDDLLEEHMKYKKETENYKKDYELTRHELITLFDHKIELDQKLDRLSDDNNELKHQNTKLQECDFYSSIKRVVDNLPGLLGIISRAFITPGIFKYSMFLIFFINIGYFLYSMGKYIDLKFILDIIKGLL